MGTLIYKRAFIKSLQTSDQMHLAAFGILSASQARHGVRDLKLFCRGVGDDRVVISLRPGEFKRGEDQDAVLIVKRCSSNLASWIAMTHAICQQSKSPSAHKNPPVPPKLPEPLIVSSIR